MNVLETIVLIVHLISCLALIAIVLLQSGKSAGLSGTIAGGAETFFGKNKGRTLDKKLETLTKIFAVLFLVCSIAFSFIIVRNKPEATDAADAAVTTEDLAGAVEGIEVDESEVGEDAEAEEAVEEAAEEATENAAE